MSRGGVIRYLASFFGLLLFLTHRGEAKPRRTITLDPGIEFGQYVSPESSPSASGSFQFDVPLSLPPGAGGWKPELTLHYDSHSEGGLFGIGWTLQGVSAIERCSKTAAQDGFFSTIHFDKNDRYCLDGKRLIATHGAYGEPGTEYTTEIESWIKIVSVGTSATGDPLSFVVSLPEGTTLSYGATSDSRLPAPNLPTTAVWAVSRRQDVSGNYITYEYGSAAQGYAAPARIAYTANDAANLKPPTVVSFDYETRPDPWLQYRAGSPFAFKERVSRINVTVLGSAVKHWTLAYDINSFTHRSRLITITETAEDGTSLPPYKFQWQDGYGGSGATWQASKSQSGLHGWGSYRWFADIDGDGLADYLVKNNDGSLHWNRFLGDSWAGNQSQAGLHGVGAERWLADIDGDGQLDYIAKNADGTIHWNLSLLASSGVWGQSLSQSGLHTWGAQRWFADINGDGRADYVVKNADNTIHWDLSVGNGTTASHWGAPQSQGGLAPWGSYRWFTDLNGDGTDDYISISTHGCFDWNLSTGDGHSPQFGPTHHQCGLHGLGADRWFVDITGDGLPDYVAKNPDGVIHWDVNTGAGWGPPMSQGGLHGWGSARWFADINGDGRADYIVKNQDGTIHWDLSQGDGTTAQQWGPPQSQSGLHGWGADRWVIDLNGDGCVDYIAKNTDGTIHWNLAACQVPDLLVRVTEPIGTNTDVEYAAASSSVHTREYVNSYPVREARSALALVSTVSRYADGVLARILRFQYKGGKYDISRRRWLGFLEVTVNDSARTISVRNLYHQTYPLDGLLMQQRVLTGGIELSQTLQAWSAETNRMPLRVRLREVSEQAHDLLSKLTSDKLTRFIYDDFGNVVDSVTVYGNDLTLKKHIDYTARLSPWIVGLPTRISTEAATARNLSSPRREILVTYDNRGRLLRRTYQPGTREESTVEYARDLLGNAIERIRSGHEVNTTKEQVMFDEYGYLRGRRNALHQEELYTTDPRFAVVTKAIDVKGRVSTVTLDGLGRPVQEQRAAGGKMEWSYTTFSAGIVRLEVRISRTGFGMIRRGFDGLGRIAFIEEPGWKGNPSRTEFLWDSAGRLVSKSGPHRIGETKAQAETYEYDPLNRLTRIRFTNEDDIFYQYVGRTTEIRQGERLLRTVTNDSLGRPVSVGAGDESIRVAYDGFGNICFVDQGSGNISAATYDAYDQLSSLSDPDYGYLVFKRDAFGRLRMQKDGNGAVTELEYDALDRLKSRVRGTERTEWKWDEGAHAVGSLSAVSRSDGFKEEYSYNERGQLAEKSEIISGRRLTIQLSYDDAERINRLTYPNGLVLSRQFDSQGFLTGLKADDTMIWQAGSYDVYGRVQEEELGLVRQEFISEPLSGRLQRISASSGKELLFEQDYSRGGDGRIHGINESTMGTSGNYVYDDAGRLAAWSSQGQFLERQGLWTRGYSSTGTSASGVLPGRIGFGRSAGPTHGLAGSDFLLRRFPQFSMPVDDVRPRYDRAGNFVQGLGLMIEYDSGGRPAKIIARDLGRDFSLRSTDISTTILIYDSEDRRVAKRVVRSKFGFSPFIEHREETLYFGRFFEQIYKGAEMIDRAYVFVQGRPVAIIEDTRKGRAVHYLIVDQTHSVRRVVDSEGLVIGSEDYTPFGEQLAKQENGIGKYTHLGFAGYEEDQESGLMNAGGRMYHPRLGRFLQPDPRILLDADPRTYDRYMYANDDPVNFIDEDGFDARSSGWGHIRDGGAELAFAAMVGYAALALAPETMGGSLLVGAVLTGNAGFVEAVIGTVELASDQELDDQAIEEAVGSISSPGAMGSLMVGGALNLDYQSRKELREVMTLVESVLDARSSFKALGNPDLKFNEAAYEVVSIVASTKEVAQAANRKEGSSRDRDHSPHDFRDHDRRTGQSSADTRGKGDGGKAKDAGKGAKDSKKDSGSKLGPGPELRLP